MRWTRCLGPEARAALLRSRWGVPSREKEKQFWAITHPKCPGSLGKPAWNMICGDTAPRVLSYCISSTKRWKGLWRSWLCGLTWYLLGCTSTDEEAWNWSVWKKPSIHAGNIVRFCAAGALGFFICEEERLVYIVSLRSVGHAGSLAYQSSVIMLITTLWISGNQPTQWNWKRWRTREAWVVHSEIFTACC